MSIYKHCNITTVAAALVIENAVYRFSLLVHTFRARE
jgi:hypothetical protein